MGENMTHPQTYGTSLSPGTMLMNRYRLEKTLGQGGFGITYAALDCKHHYRVAVKELFPSRCVTRAENQRTVVVSQGQDESFRFYRERFEKEARTLISLQHLEGVVRLMHFFAENNTVYYVMELLEGEDLMHRLKREKTMRWDQLAPILNTTMKALDQLHTAGLIHRDISPDNIYLTPAGARLIDFGSVRNYQGQANFTAMVKKNFAPWEQFLSNGKQGPWTDVYALAVTAYYALSGHLPPPATDRKLNDTLVPLDQYCPNLPRDICTAIHRGMAIQPEQRFQRMSDFRYALHLTGTPGQHSTSGLRLVCARGVFAGKSWSLQPDKSLRIGRNSDCDICYPPESRGISRAQCTVYCTREGKCFVRDDGSSYGTGLKHGSSVFTMEPRTWYAAEGSSIVFGSQQEYIILR